MKRSATASSEKQQQKRKRISTGSNSSSTSNTESIDSFTSPPYSITNSDGESDVEDPDVPLGVEASKPGRMSEINIRPRIRPTVEKTEVEDEDVVMRDPLNTKKYSKLYGISVQQNNGLQFSALSPLFAEIILDIFNVVHSKNLTNVHHILRTFDLSNKYGPCIGMSRIERWNRANEMGLNPPIEVTIFLN